VIVLRDQRKSITALETAEAADALPPGATMAAAEAAGPAAAGTPAADASPEAVDDATAAGQPGPTQPVAVAQARQVATVERGRITTLGAVVTVDWLIILILMVWR
jgi:hypothetical protein